MGQMVLGHELLKSNDSVELRYDFTATHSTLHAPIGWDTPKV